VYNNIFKLSPDQITASFTLVNQGQKIGNKSLLALNSSVEFSEVWRCFYINKSDEDSNQKLATIPEPKMVAHTVSVFDFLTRGAESLIFAISRSIVAFITITLAEPVPDLNVHSRILRVFIGQNWTT
jgi:hypothetical protein